MSKNRIMRSVLALGCAGGILVLASCAGGVAGTPAAGTDGDLSVTFSGSTSGTTTSRTAPTTRTTPSGGTTAPSTSSDITLSNGLTLSELGDDLDGAVEVADRFWADNWSKHFTGEYTPPTVRGLYDGEDPADTPECGGDPLSSFNAFYCPDGDYVAWDAGLIIQGAEAVGDTWVYLVVAHEWGHAVQARLEPALVAESFELQADCLAAAALFGSQADGVLDIEEGDEKEMVSSLSVLADEMPWTSSSDHGDPFQRVEWFALGRDGGVEACLDAVGSSVDTGSGPSRTAMPPAPPTGASPPAGPTL